VKLTTHLILVPRLRIGGAVKPRHAYFFMTFTEKKLTNLWRSGSWKIKTLLVIFVDSDDRLIRSSDGVAT